MPAKRKTQKEDILKASISIISHEGLNALNARKIAKKLGCSTQPLFYIYENMDVLKKDVIDEIVKIFDREVLKSETGQLEYKDIGINYIRFAKEEHELFKIMFNRKINEGAFDFIDLTVDLPAGQLCGKTGVLTLIADCKRKLCVGNRNVAGLCSVGVDFHRHDFCGGQRFTYKCNGIVGIFDNVDFLSAKLVNDFGNAGTLGTDTCADGVDVVVLGPNGDFGAGTGLAGN